MISPEELLQCQHDRQYPSLLNRFPCEFLDVRQTAEHVLDTLKRPRAKTDGRRYGYRLFSCFPLFVCGSNKLAHHGWDERSVCRAPLRWFPPNYHMGTGWVGMGGQVGLALKGKDNQTP